MSDTFRENHVADPTAGFGEFARMDDGKTSDRPWMKGECYHNKFHPTEPQCTNTEVNYPETLGNPTDNWTWCRKHMPVRNSGKEGGKA